MASTHHRYHENSPLTKSDVLQMLHGSNNSGTGNPHHTDTDDSHHRHSNMAAVGRSDIITTNNNHNHKSDTDNPSTTDDHDHNDDQERKRHSGFKLLAKMSGRQRWVLLLSTLALFWSHFSYSLLGPFFPLEAIPKGMTMGSVGLVYGIFEGIIFLTSPIFGTYLVRLGPRFVFFSGIFVAGSCNILFGCLRYCPGGYSFIVISILLRAVEAFGCSGFMTACYAFVSSEFKENVAFTFGIVESGVGLGYTLGPTIGGALYELGGFGLPFYFAGVAMFLNGIALYKLLPLVDGSSAKYEGSIWILLRNPLVIISACSVMVGAGSIAAYDGTFSKRMEPLGFSVGVVGLLYGGLAVVYSLMSSIWGYICDCKDVQAPLIVGGQLVFAVGFLLLGPSFILPFIPFNLTTVLIGLWCLGVSFGCTLVPTMKCMVMGALETGLEDNVHTYALVSGLFTSFMTFGASVGPIAVGYLVQDFGFPIAYTAPALCTVVMMLVSLIYFLYRNYRQRRSYNNIGHI